MAEIPQGIIMSVHEDLERSAKPKNRFRPDGLYMYITATRDRIDSLRPVLYAAMRQVRSSGYAVYTGQDDPELRMYARNGIIEDGIDQSSEPDGSLEKWFALASLAGMTADGSRKMHYPVVYTIEFPGRASEPEKKDLLSIMMDALITPTWNHLYPHYIQ